MTLSDYPNAWPAMTLDFLNSKQLDPRITFTRATTATETGNATGDVNGEVYTFPQNVPRLTDQGLLIEQESTNEEIWSTAFSNWGNNGSAINVTDNAEIAPDGTQTASTLANTNTTNAGRSLFSAAQLARTGQQTAQQLWIRRVSGTDPQPTIRLQTIGGGPGVTLAPPTNEWQQIISIQTTLSPGTFNAQQIDFTGAWDTQGTPNDNVYAVWGSQIENNQNFVTSYIATNGTAVTRAADVVAITGNDFSSWFSGTVTMVISAETEGPIDTSERVVEFIASNGASPSRFRRNTSAQWGWARGSAPGFELNVDGVTSTSVKIAAQADFGDTFVGVNGKTNTGGSSQDNTSNSEALDFNGVGKYLKYFAYYSTPLTDDELEALAT